MKIISGSSNEPLADDVVRYIKTHTRDELTPKALTERDLKTFKDGELYVEIKENVRGQDVYVVQSTCKPTNDNLMELLIMCDALQRSSARRITVVIPYFGYARQDRKTAPRSPISAKLVANLITRAGADRVLTLDLHAGQIQGFFDVPLDNLTAAPVFAHHIRHQEGFDAEKIMIVSPDVGGVVRARKLAEMLNADLAIIDKRRPEAGVSEVMHVIGQVKGRDCILVDDIVDSAGTLCNAARALIDQGAASVRAYCTHGVLSEPALKNIAASPLAQLCITDSIQATPQIMKAEKIEQISIANLLGEAMLRIRDDESVSFLFDTKWLEEAD